MLRSRRILAVLGAFALLSTSVAVPSATQGATPCYWGAWQTADQGWYSTAQNTSFSSQVRYRLGYTCTGSQMTEWEIDWRQITIKTGIGSPGEYMGSTWGPREFQYWNVFDQDQYGNDIRRRHTDPDDPNCLREVCTFYEYDGVNLRGASVRPWINAQCEGCTASGFGSLGMIHYFKARQLTVVVGVPPIGT